MAIHPSELDAAREAIRKAGGDPGHFTFAAYDKSPPPGKPMFQYVEVYVPGVKSRVYEAGPGTAWIAAFEADLLKGAFSRA